MLISASVGDADNFRLYHTPGIGWNWPLKFRRIPSTSKGERLYLTEDFRLFNLCVADLKDQTLHIRIAGVDAPEVRISPTRVEFCSTKRVLI